ncbi:MAG: hypothetical protein IPL27_19840 [Lewinellaceae bacterium]|nr:hypothetical protein [Lewinellaceae bacterium]
MLRLETSLGGGRRVRQLPFSDGSNWSEIRDVLIIAMYEKSYDRGKRIDAELSQIENPNQEIEN